VVNGERVTDPAVYINDRVYVPAALQKEGTNQIQVYFESEFVKDCQGIHWFKDTDDQEYVFSNLEPANCHMWFPCFDQPDLKAP